MTLGTYKAAYESIMAYFARCGIEGQEADDAAVLFIARNDQALSVDYLTSKAVFTDGSGAKTSIEDALLASGIKPTSGAPNGVVEVTGDAMRSILENGTLDPNLKYKVTEGANAGILAPTMAKAAAAATAAGSVTEVSGAEMRQMLFDGSLDQTKKYRIVG